MTYSYDACGNFSKGRLCSVTNSVSVSSYTYDALGRVATSAQTTPGYALPFNFTYAYKLNGALKGMSYPSGRVVEYGFNTKGQVNRVTNGPVDTPISYYANSITYAPHGGMLTMTAGTGLVEERQYNARQQPTQIKVGTLMTLDFGYGTTANNGNVQSQTITRPSVSSLAGYGYDDLNRLTSATQTGTGAWSQTYGYDAFGNRSLATYSGLPDPTLEVPRGSGAFLANNRIGNVAPAGNWSYDNAGNVTGIPALSGNVRTSTYDAENRQLTATNSQAVTATYSYDGEGRRIKKTVNGNTTTFVYDATGQLAAEYGGEAAPADEVGTRFLFEDHLGSTRLMANASGSQIKTYDYLPFGEEIGSFYPALGGPNAVKFTGHLKDSETGLDFMQARYYSGTQGRFTSADAPLLAQKTIDPQSWNLYTYARNNPLRFIDPDGHQDIPALPDCKGDEKCFEDFNKAQIDAQTTVAKGVAVIGAVYVGAELGVWATLRAAATAAYGYFLRNPQVGEEVVEALAPEGVTLAPKLSVHAPGTSSAGPFVVTEGGTVVHQSQGAMVRSLEGAGFQGKPLSSPGTAYTLENGVTVRAMQPSGPNQTRASFNRGANPVTPEGKVPQPPRNNPDPRTSVRQRTHVNQKP